MRGGDFRAAGPQVPAPAGRGGRYAVAADLRVDVRVGAAPDRLGVRAEDHARDPGGEARRLGRQAVVGGAVDQLLAPRARRRPRSSATGSRRARSGSPRSRCRRGPRCRTPRCGGRPRRGRSSRPSGSRRADATALAPCGTVSFMKRAEARCARRRSCIASLAASRTLHRLVGELVVERPDADRAGVRLHVRRRSAAARGTRRRWCPRPSRAARCGCSRSRAPASSAGPTRTARRTGRAPSS